MVMMEMICLLIIMVLICWMVVRVNRICVASMDRGSRQKYHSRGEGDDEIYLGTGTHRITGGQGNDTFNFSAMRRWKAIVSIWDFEKTRIK